MDADDVKPGFLIDKIKKKQFYFGMPNSKILFFVYIPIYLSFISGI